MAPRFCSLITESMDRTSALFRYGGVGLTKVSAHVRRLTSLVGTSDVRQKTGVALFLKVRMLSTAQRARLILALDWLVSTPSQSARASLPLTRKFSLYIKALARCVRPLPVCSRTARGPRRATEKPGLRPQVRQRRARSPKGEVRGVVRHIWGSEAELEAWARRSDHLCPPERVPGGLAGPSPSSPLGGAGLTSHLAHSGLQGNGLGCLCHKADLGSLAFVMTLARVTAPRSRSLPVAAFPPFCVHSLVLIAKCHRWNFGNGLVSPRMEAL